MTEVQGLIIGIQLLCVIVMLFTIQSQLWKIIDLLSNKKN